ncbi:MAG: MOSC domain-containing protein [Pseudomonadota bacterium]
MEGDLRRLTETFTQPGAIRWIGVRPDRRALMTVLERAEVVSSGLRGDRRTGPGKRAVTLIQAEHLPVIAALSGYVAVDPALLRRNIVVSGVNLLGLRKIRFRIGSAILRGTGLCAPCSRMEESLGPGGYTAMRGHGGITAEVLEPGEIALGDAVTPLLDATETCPCSPKNRS